MSVSEIKVESQAIDLFKSMGYSCEYGPNLFEKTSNSFRNSYAETILYSVLESALVKVNPSVPFEAIQEAIHIIKQSHTLNLFEQNRKMYDWIKNGLHIEFSYNKNIQTEHINLIDFENPDNNDWLVVNQFSVKTIGKPRRADLVVFVNGLCLSLFEFKNPADLETDVWEAFNQIETYKEDVPELFAFNVLNVISDGIETKYGSLFSPKERFLEWKTIDSDEVNPLGENSMHLLETTIRGIFDKNRFLNFIQNFVVFESSGTTFTKKIAGYHQFNAVNAALESILKAHESTESPRKGGVTWHTQGAGKSIEMLCLVGKIQKHPKLKNPTVLLVTDRNDLDGQLYETFVQSQFVVSTDSTKIESRTELRTKVSGIKAGGLFFTTIQKFEPGQDNDVYPVLTDRSNVIVIVDEAHRSQYGFKGALDNTKTKFGYAKYLRDALPGAIYYAFSGTPLETADKDTTAVFGNYTHVYDMAQATKDKATVPIYYQQCKIPLSISAATDLLDSEVESLLSVEDNQLQGELKAKWASLNNIVCADSRIKKLVDHFLSHFASRQDVLIGKAMIVCISREECVKVYNEIIRNKPTWHDTDYRKGKVKIMMTGSASDSGEYQPHIYSKAEKEAIASRLKNPEDELDIIIVRDMWLTGFDAPCLHTMYIDKPMKGHSLMQAIARINRVFKDKPGGLVVDYIGIGAELQEAVSQYSKSDKIPEIAQAISVAEVLFKDELKIIQGMLYGFDYSNFKLNGYSLLPYAMDYILSRKNGKKDFCDAVIRLEKAYSICKTSPDIFVFAYEVAFLSAVKVALQKQGASNKKLSIINNDGIVKSLISNAIVGGNEVVNILNNTDKISSNTALLSDDFLNSIRRLETKNLAVELLRKLLQNLIKSKLHTNHFQNNKFSTLLTAIVDKYNLRHADTNVIIDELIGTIKDCQLIVGRGNALGLSREELGIFDVLNDELSDFEGKEEKIKEYSTAIWRRVKSELVTDWFLRDSAKAKVKIAVRHSIRNLWQVARLKGEVDNKDKIIDKICEQLEYL